MTRTQTQFECQSCGAVFPRWQGRCDTCQDWNSLVEVVLKKKNAGVTPLSKSIQKPIPLSDIEAEQVSVIPTTISEFDHTLGKGLVKGAVTLLGGEPGIGKSTLSLQIALSCAEQGLKVLYVSGEESPSQLQLRAKRLTREPKSLSVLSEVDMTSILHVLDDMNPDVVILDSIQVVYHPDISGMGGTVSQVRHCANCFIEWIKLHNKTGILIGHITKEGNLAGPKVLEHMVDVILYLEGERTHHFRILRCYKNRFGTTTEIGVFDMKEEGLVGVSHHSELFLSDLSQENPGSIVSATLEGNRVFLVEMQALVVASGYGMGKRSFVGVESNRANLIIAVLEKMVGIKLSQRDVFLNIIGGLKVVEPALDLAMALAMISSVDDRVSLKKVAAIGEIGLTGEIRPVPGMEKRLNELKKMGFSACYVPAKTNVKLSEKGSLELIFVKHVSDAIKHFITQTRHHSE